MLTIYKASAGSGKTFQLVTEYIKLLLENPGNYRHILAVTFTNKATNEMKSRILQQLYSMANNEGSDYLEHLRNETGFTGDFIRERAKTILKNILHDYNRFSVTTIDSFTQRTIKAFNRELGISPNFTLELDSDMILAEATDRLLAKIDKDKKLLGWLKDFSREKIEENKSQRIEDDIKNLGRELFRENFQSFFPENSKSVYDRKQLKEFSTELKKIKAQFEAGLKMLGEKGMEIIGNNDLDVSDFSYGSTGVAGYIQKIANGEVKEAGTRVLEATENAEKWYISKNPRRSEIHNLAELQLQPLLKEILLFIEEQGEFYFTAAEVLKELRVLGILTDLKEEIRNLLHEKSILQLSDSNYLLNKIIDGSDSPFIYEKTGSFYRHFMLDEFQDTSGLQWKNFKPLVQNSLAEGNSNLLVGDVKQAIYRWRNSNWEILGGQVNNDFQHNQTSEKTLEKNWRSNVNIIQFNNSFFETLKNVFTEFQFRGFNDFKEGAVEKFLKVYESVSQMPGKTRGKEDGLVRVQFIDDENFKENSVFTLIQQIKKLQDKGIKASETAILVRTNTEGTFVIEKILEVAKKAENEGYNLSVLSNDSLVLNSSQPVLFIVNVVKLLIDAENQVAKAALLTLWDDWLKPGLQQQKTKFDPEKNEITTETQNQKISLLFQLEEAFENSGLAEKMLKIKDKILLSSLDESLTKIASEFGLFEMGTGLPFVQTLIDKAGELKATLSNDLSNFLFWWEEKGQKTSVSVNEELDSIRLLTVHKSKGLEYNAVLIPFFDWNSNHGRNTPILWCKPGEPPFDLLPLLPVRASQNLKKTLFSNDYFQEKLNQFIDVFNLVYVAFTRAKSVLIVHSPQIKETKKPDSDSSRPIQFLLKQALDLMCKTPEFENSFETESGVFEFGKIPIKISVKQQSDSELIKHYSFNDFEDRLKLRLAGENFLIKNHENELVKNKGKLIHEILAEIKTAADVEPACNNAFLRGKIKENELAEIVTSLKESLENQVISKWFDGSFKVLNEQNLLTTEQIFRPDRIMLKENVAVVVDFKTGVYKSDSYPRQVKRYSRILKETGIEKVEGYIWYTTLNEVEKICDF